MPASEEKRLALRNRLIEVLGEEEAEVLMESLPPFDWHQLATKDDIRGTHKAIDALEERLRTEMNAGFTNLRTEMDGRFAMVEAEFKMLRAENKEIRAENKEFRGENKEFRGEMALQFAKQTRTMVFTMLGVSLPTWGAILAVGLG
ncbi:hypothetical protein [Candidatus Poriferisocius sp.]|uniref:hypothetical protein n=1 Tax=Candidatus Poriferisocius sp. TaxID=3101276 RepID=UPI003B02812A